MNEIVKREEFSLEKIDKASMKFDKSEDITGIKPTKYFPFIQILQALSNDSNRFGKGIMIVKKNGKDEDPHVLGDKFDAIPLAIRAKAAWFSPKGGVVAEYVTPKMSEPSEDYIKYRDAALKNPGFNNEYKSGLEVLVWIPNYGFATYWANSAKMTSALEENVSPYLGDKIKFGCKVETNSKGSFYVPYVFTEEWEEEYAPPDGDTFNGAMNLFMYPPKNTQEQEDLEEAATSRAR